MSDLNYKIIFSKKSEVDLIGILQYTETTFGYLQKEVYQGKFFKAFSNLSKHPEIGHKNKHLQENLKVLRIEKQGRGGKTVTVITGLALNPDDLKALAKTLKQRCGTGGAIRDGAIEIQGDHRETLRTELQARGLAVKLSGG